MKTTFNTCYDAYSEGNEDKTPYNKPGWIPVDDSRNRDDLNLPRPWNYQKPAETDKLPKWGRFALYPGGGFVADLSNDKTIGIDINETLQRHGWLDRQSRVVILEFSAFNPPSNLLVVGTYFYEIQPSGFKAPFERIKTISVLSEETGWHQFYLVSVVIFAIFALLYVGRICYSVYKQRLHFFKSFWNWLEILKVVFSVLAVVTNILRSSEALSTVRKMEANINANLNFQEVIVWKEAEDGVLGVLMFLVTLKLLRVIRYIDQVAVFSRALNESAKLLWSFMPILFIAFMAFLHCGIVMFGPELGNYSSLLNATYFQLELILGKVRKRPIDELSEAFGRFGRIFVSAILLSLTVFLMTFIIAVINGALISAKNAIIPNEAYDLVDEVCPNNETRNKRVFDIISRGIKQGVTRAKQSLVRKKADKLSKKDPVNAIVDSGIMSKAIVAPRATKENPESSKTAKNDDNDAVKQPSQTLSACDATDFKIEELNKKEKQLFQYLDNIIQADYDEEHMFDLLYKQRMVPIQYRRSSTRTNITRHRTKTTTRKISISTFRSHWTCPG